jgi:hypothetical protein
LFLEEGADPVNKRSRQRTRKDEKEESCRLNCRAARGATKRGEMEMNTKRKIGRGWPLGLGSREKSATDDRVDHQSTS